MSHKWKKKQIDWLKAHGDPDEIVRKCNEAITRVLNEYGLPYTPEQISLEYMREVDQLTPPTLVIQTIAWIEKWMDEIRSRLTELTDVVNAKSGEIYGFLCSIQKEILEVNNYE